MPPPEGRRAGAPRQPWARPRPGPAPALDPHERAEVARKREAAKKRKRIETAAGEAAGAADVDAAAAGRRWKMAECALGAMVQLEAVTAAGMLVETAGVTQVAAAAIQLLRQGV